MANGAQISFLVVSEPGAGHQEGHDGPHWSLKINMCSQGMDTSRHIPSLILSAQGHLQGRWLCGVLIGVVSLLLYQSEVSRETKPIGYTYM